MLRTFAVSAFGLMLVACGGAEAPVAPAAAAPETTPPAVVAEPVPQGPALDAIPAMLAGEWVSIDDAKSKVTITADGKWTGIYDGEPIGPASTWRVLSSEDAKAATTENKDAFQPDGTYLEVKDADLTFWYELGDISADFFETFYLPRGNRLAFNRVK